MILYVISLSTFNLAKKDIWWCWAWEEFNAQGGAAASCAFIKAASHMLFRQIMYAIQIPGWLYNQKILHLTCNFWVYCHNKIFISSTPRAGNNRT